MLRSTLLLAAALAALPAAEMAAADPAATIGGLRFLGATTLPNDDEVDGTLVGGLSGIDYDPASQEWAIISDDKSDHAPARFYLARIALDGGAPQVTLEHAVMFREQDGSPYPNTKTGGDVPDPESIRFDPSGKALWWTSEGSGKLKLTPFIRETAPDGKFMASFPLPAMFDMQDGKTTGPRDNLAFEGLSFTPDHQALWLGMETALGQDGPIATVEAGSVARFTKFDRSGKVLAQYAYPLDPIQRKPAGPYSDNGVSEVLALDDGRLLVVERSGVQGAGDKWTMYIRLYEADTEGATDVSGIAALKGARYQPMKKRLILDLSKMPEIGSKDLPSIDNIEGVSFGPNLADGHRSLVLVSDNNFNPDQITQFLAFEVLP
jgi:hypothetical protein